MVVFKLQIVISKLRIGVLKLQVGVSKLRFGISRLRNGISELQDDDPNVENDESKLRIGLTKLRNGVLKLRDRVSIVPSVTDRVGGRQDRRQRRDHRAGGVPDGPAVPAGARGGGRDITPDGAVAGISPRMVSWSWAVNAAASVFGSVCAVLVSMTAGFGAAMLMGIGAYALALVAARMAALTRR
jgi:hypothetical protein